MDETLLRDRSNESYWAVNSCGTVYYAVAEAHHLTKAIEQYSHVVLFIMLYKVDLTLVYVNETVVCDHSNESY